MPTLPSWLSPSATDAAQPPPEPAYYPLNADDFVGDSGNLNALGCIRDWPKVLSTSATLASLLDKDLNATHVRSVMVPPKFSEASVCAALKAISYSEIELRPYESFTNATALISVLPAGWKLMKGFCVHERLDKKPGRAFCAVRHWWVSSPTGKWVDLTPPTVAATWGGNALLVESALGGEKPMRLRTRLQSGVDMIERVTGLDLDRDGTVGGDVVSDEQRKAFVSTLAAKVGPSVSTATPAYETLAPETAKRLLDEAQLGDSLMRRVATGSVYLLQKTEQQAEKVASPIAGAVGKTVSVVGKSVGDAGTAVATPVVGAVSTSVGVVSTSVGDAGTAVGGWLGELSGRRNEVNGG